MLLYLNRFLWLFFKLFSIAIYKKCFFSLHVLLIFLIWYYYITSLIRLCCHNVLFHQVFIAIRWLLDIFAHKKVCYKKPQSTWMISFRLIFQNNNTIIWRCSKPHDLAGGHLLKWNLESILYIFLVNKHWNSSQENSPCA